MLPVVQPAGRSTGFRILIYSVALLPVSLLPVLLRMAGTAYLVGATLLGIVLLLFAARMV